MIIVVWLMVSVVWNWPIMPVSQWGVNLNYEKLVKPSNRKKLQCHPHNLSRSASGNNRVINANLSTCCMSNHQKTGEKPLRAYFHIWKDRSVEYQTTLTSINSSIISRRAARRSCIQIVALHWQNNKTV